MATTQWTLLDVAYELINGMKWDLDGVDGTLHVIRDRGITNLEHRASEDGRASEEYRRIRRQLGDDYTTTLDFSSDEVNKIFAAVSDRADQILDLFALRDMASDIEDWRTCDEIDEQLRRLWAA